MAGSRFRVKDGFGIAGGVLFLAALLAVFLLVLGVGRGLAREVVPVLVDVPGGAWVAGGALGILSVLGWIGGALVFGAGAANKAREGRPLRVARAVGSAVCWVAAIGPVLLLFSGLPSRNCRSYTCEYLPGTGTAFLAYAVTAGLLGLLCHRRRRALVEAGEAERRERRRALRKRGKGKGRAARQR
ncbi:hypothetical protein [Streptomyces sp. NPDC087859]|uniref:hypothetical protein n=1 Tax=Streptomyces sp. NPDC087859 TaxID=3365812 RepID=UPI0038156860